MSVILITFFCKNITNCTRKHVILAKNSPFQRKISLRVQFVMSQNIVSHKIISPLAPRLLRILYLRDFLSENKIGFTHEFKRYDKCVISLNKETN